MLKLTSQSSRLLILTNATSAIMHEEILGQLDLRLFKSTWEKKSPFPKTRKEYVASLALWCIIINPIRQAWYNIAYMIAHELSQQLVYHIRNY